MCTRGDHGTPFISSIYASRSCCHPITVPCCVRLSSEPSNCYCDLFCQRTRAFTIRGSSPIQTSNAILREIRLLFCALIICISWSIQACCATDIRADSDSSRHSQSHSTGVNLSVWNYPEVMFSLAAYSETNRSPDRAKRGSASSNSKPLRNRMQTHVLSESNGSLASSDKVELKFLTDELVDFVCHRLPDSCTRAAYLRRHVRHSLCIHLPILYLLPHVAILINQPNISRAAHRTNLCNGALGSLKFTESDHHFDLWLNSAQMCEQSLTQLLSLITDRLEEEFIDFDKLLAKSFCKLESDANYNATGEFRCEECRNAYKDWLCAEEFPLYFPLDVWDPVESERSPHLPPFDSLHVSPVSPTPTLTTTPLSSSSSSSLSAPYRPSHSPSSSRGASHASSSVIPTRNNRSVPLSLPKLSRSARSGHTTFHLVSLPPCQSWCTEVETLCPHFNPQEQSSNGGEPAFLCHESHYHHSSQYRDVYQKEDYCQPDCCYSLSDVEHTVSLSSAVGPDQRSGATGSGFQVHCPSLSVRCRHLSYTGSAIPLTVTLPAQQQVSLLSLTPSDTSYPNGTATSKAYSLLLYHPVYCLSVLTILFCLRSPCLLDITSQLTTRQRRHRFVARRSTALPSQCTSCDIAFCVRTSTDSVVPVTC
ncbi:unnamed protein product [Dicrocoelium dendriticum]|nr:unnamed protein product [Dicrocoelium dendriticum]